MSFQMPSNPDSAASAETARLEERELEAAAARYAHTHPGDGEPPPRRGLIARALARLRPARRD